MYRVRHLTFFFLTSAYFVNAAERIWLCIRLNNAGKWASDQLTEDAEIIFSDELHFDLGGYKNKQNYSIWVTEDPHAYIEKPTYPKRVTVSLFVCFKNSGKWAYDRLTEDDEIIFLDQVHFDLGGYENKQNYYIWGTENPHAYIEKPTHTKRVTVWCGFLPRDKFRPFFFENNMRSLQSMAIVMGPC